MSRAGAGVLVLVAFAPCVAAAVLLWPDRAGDGGAETAGASASRAAPTRAPASARESVEPEIGASLGSASLVEVEFKDPPRAGVLFDVATGEILWKRAAGKEL